MKKKSVLAMIMLLGVFFVAGCTKPEEQGDIDPQETIENINPSYVPIDWDNATIVSSDENTGNYQIQFNSAVPDVRPGSILTIDRDTAVHYIFVTAVNVNGNILSLASTEAYLTDIFFDTEFTLTTATNSSKSSTHGPVFRPVAAFVRDNKGICRTLDLKRRKGETHFTHDLWRYTMNNDGYVLHVGNHDSIILDRMNMDLDMDFEMYMNFSGRDVHEVENDAIDRYMSRALQVNAALIGDFNTEQQIRCKSWGSSQIGGVAVTLVSDMFPLPTLRFMAGPVPVIIKVQPDLCCQMEMNSSDVIQAYTGFKAHATGRMGFEWRQTGGMTPVHSVENSFQYTPPTLEGKGEIQAKVWIFPRINFLLYGILGPTIGVMPYTNHVVRGGFREQMLGQNNDYCAWTYDHHTGLDICSALNFSIFGRWIYNDILGGVADLHTPIVNITDRLLYHSPTSVVYTSGRPGPGETGTVFFTVYDHDFERNTDVLTPFPQIMKFEANGQLSSEYGIANNGIATVDWTPTNNDVLYAKLYDIDGNVISWDSVQISGDDPSDDWVDMGFPSGLLWANRNVGANTPEEYGDYFAWAETQPKSLYSINTYNYYYSDGTASGSGFTKYIVPCRYWDYGYNGFVDSLIVLQPSDDAATANWGDGARIPTYDEWYELYNNATWHWITQNGVQGWMFRSNYNGNTLFFPVAGYYDEVGLHDEGSKGHYWSSTLSTEHPNGALSMMLYMGIVWGQSTRIATFVGMYRPWGLSVRAVRSPDM